MKWAISPLVIALLLGTAPGDLSAQGASCWFCTFNTPPTCQQGESGGDSCFVDYSPQHGWYCWTVGFCEDLEGVASVEVAMVPLSRLDVPAIVIKSWVVEDCRGNPVRRVYTEAGRSERVREYRTISLTDLQRDQHPSSA